MKTARHIITLILLVCITLLTTVQPVQAHILPNQPPFFKINGKLSGLYPIPQPPIASFVIPQDIAPENYLVNDVLNFEIDTTSLGMPKEIIDQTKFIWDYGDGKSAEGLINTHAYTKPGSYILTITLDVTAFSKANKPQLFQSILINIFPTKDYKLPDPRIVINNRESKDPFTDMFDVKTNSLLDLDATPSQPGSENIIEYHWSFGDGESSKEIITQHAYKPNWSMAFPILRVKDKNGFIADTFVILRQKDDMKDTIDVLGTNTQIHLNSMPIVLTGGLVVLIIGYILISVLKKK